MDKTPERILPCPTCRKPVRWSTDNRWRPFCSERCRLIDFGTWASEGYRIADDAAANDETEEEP